MKISLYENLDFTLRNRKMPSW